MKKKTKNKMSNEFVWKGGVSLDFFGLPVFIKIRFLRKKIPRVAAAAAAAASNDI